MTTITTITGLEVSLSPDGTQIGVSLLGSKPLPVGKIVEVREGRAFQPTATNIRYGPEVLRAIATLIDEVTE